MKIETKFNIGDEVWAMVNNKALEAEVSHIVVDVHETKIIISLKTLEGYILNEKECFDTKQELLDSL